MPNFLRKIIFYLKIFNIKHPYFLFYLLYVLCVIIIVPYVYYNDFFEFFSHNQNIKNNTIIQDNIEINDLELKKAKNVKKEVPFYDTKNPLAGALVFLVIELCCFYLK